MFENTAMQPMKMQEHWGSQEKPPRPPSVLPEGTKPAPLDGAMIDDKTAKTTKNPLPKKSSSER